MSKFIGTIIDKSYYQIYQRTKGNKIFYYRICPFCDKELDEGSSNLNGGDRTEVLSHICEFIKEFRRNFMPELTMEKYKSYATFEWGQFIFKEANDEESQKERT